MVSLSETATTGKTIILCDEKHCRAYEACICPFDSSYSEAKVEVVPVSAREGISPIIRYQSTGALSYRVRIWQMRIQFENKQAPPLHDYLLPMLLCSLAAQFPLDTISLDQLKTFTDQSASLRGMFPAARQNVH